MIVLGLTETLLNAAAGGLMVTPNVLFTLEYEAVKVAAVEESPSPAVTLNVADVDPAGTVTLAGTLAAVVLELESDTEDAARPSCCRQVDRSCPGLPADDRAGADRNAAERRRCRIDGHAERFVDAGVGGRQRSRRRRAHCARGHGERR